MIVLDTHILIRFVDQQGHLSAKAKQAIDTAKIQENSLFVSSITAWEIAMLVKKERLVLGIDVESWIAETYKIPSIRYIPIDNEVGIKSTQLPGEFHKDPADRLIVALARKYALPLVTADEKILDYPHVKTIW